MVEINRGQIKGIFKEGEKRVVKNIKGNK